MTSIENDENCCRGGTCRIHEITLANRASLSATAHCDGSLNIFASEPERGGEYAHDRAFLDVSRSELQAIVRMLASVAGMSVTIIELENA